MANTSYISEEIIEFIQKNMNYIIAEYMLNAGHDNQFIGAFVERNTTWISRHAQAMYRMYEKVNGSIEGFKEVYSTPDDYREYMTGTMIDSILLTMYS